MGRWDDERVCKKCGKVHDCELYAKLERSLVEQYKRFEMMVDWYASMLERIFPELETTDKDEQQ